VALKPFKASNTMTKIKKPVTEPSNGFAAHIKATIERLGFTDKQAANYLGVPVFTLRKWLTGERLPNAATHKLIEVLHMVETLAPAIHQLLIKGIK
jgi:DNA-binding transcriptional regulator YiaG